MSKKESIGKEKQQEKKSRAKYECPKPLKPLIDLINLVPLNIRMLPSSSITEVSKINTDDSSKEIALQGLKSLIMDLPKDFQTHFNNLQEEVRKEISNVTVGGIKAIPGRSQTDEERQLDFEVVSFIDYRTIPPDELELLCVDSFITKYDEFYDLRENVLRFAETRNMERKEELRSARHYAKVAKDVAEHQAELDAGRTNVPIKFYPVVVGDIFKPKPVAKYFDKKGQLIISAPILKDENGKDYLGGFAQFIGAFDSDRLRICEICSKLFWAKRVESETCSPPCFNNLRQRLYRNLTDEEKEARKILRAKTRQSKEKAKKAKEKRLRNG